MDNLDLINISDLHGYMFKDLDYLIAKSEELSEEYDNEFDALKEFVLRLKIAKSLMIIPNELIDAIDEEYESYYNTTEQRSY